MRPNIAAERSVPQGPKVSCCQAALFAWTIVIIVAERTMLIYCFVYYLWFLKFKWAVLTIVLLLPGTIAQVLSYKWHCADGDEGGCCLAFIHSVHFALFKRLCECMCSISNMEGTASSLAAVIMQQADASALRLLEALVLTLPQTVMQTYILLSTDEGLLSPVFLCCAVCLVSLAWALVLYNRACFLIRPGHLVMTPAALLCQLLWRVSMLGARIASLMFFARLFSWWVFGVIGFHWLTATFWLVSQQTDICGGPWRWRLFNCILGVVHVFFFLNVKDGPSRFRMAGYYSVTFLENAILLLSASDFLGEATWDGLGIPTSVFCGFLLGTLSLVLYYRFLHPKSTEISQKGWNGHSGGGCLEGWDSNLSLGDKSPAAANDPIHGNLNLRGFASRLAHHPGSCDPGQSVPCRHHHWLIIRLALKTGNLAKINRAYGSGGVEAMLDVVKAAEVRNREEPPAKSEAQADPASPSEGKEEFQSANEPASSDDDDDEELESEGSLEPPATGFKRGSPEGKSLLEDVLEPNFCATESTTTLYFTADPQSPSSASFRTSPQSPGRESQEPESPYLCVPRRQVVLSWNDTPEMF